MKDHCPKTGQHTGPYLTPRTEKKVVTIRGKVTVQTREQIAEAIATLKERRSELSAQIEQIDQDLKAYKNAI
jgi:prefoldin subunit 5